MSSSGCAVQTEISKKTDTAELPEPDRILLSEEHRRSLIQAEDSDVLPIPNEISDGSRTYSESAAAAQPTETVSTTMPSKSQEVGDIEACARPGIGGSEYSIFTKRQKQYIVFLTACGGFFSPLSANIYFPALNSLAKDLKVSNELINLTLTSYMIFQGLAPTIFGDLADMAGRRPAYMIGFIIYIGANIGLALQNKYAALFILRCL